MAEVVDTPDVELKDFITGYFKKATYDTGTVTLAHSGDGVTITIKAPATKLVLRHRQEERVNERIIGPLGNDLQAPKKYEITHEDNLYTLDATEPSITIVNDNEKTTTQKNALGMTMETFYDFNHYITIDSVEGAKIKPQLPPTDTGTSGAAFDPIPWIIGIIVLVVIAALVYWFFLRGRTVLGHTFGKPKAKAAPVAPATPAPAPAPAPATPAPAPEVKP